MKHIFKIFLKPILTNICIHANMRRSEDSFKEPIPSLLLSCETRRSKSSCWVLYQIPLLSKPPCQPHNGVLMAVDFIVKRGIESRRIYCIRSKERLCMKFVGRTCQSSKILESGSFLMEDYISINSSFY